MNVLEQSLPQKAKMYKKLLKMYKFALLFQSFCGKSDTSSVL